MIANFEYEDLTSDGTTNMGNLKCVITGANMEACFPCCCRRLVVRIIVAFFYKATFT
jgi:hypothetical protein